MSYNIYFLQEMEVCLICNSGEGQLTALTQRGLDSIQNFAKLHKDEHVESHSKADKTPFIHKTCQNYFTNKRRLKQNKAEVKTQLRTETRSKSSTFLWSKQCLFFEDTL